MSLGSQQYMAVIVSSSFAFNWGFSPVTFIMWNTLFGLTLGFLVGYIFSRLRILPMVYGLGVALILECVSFAANANGISFFGEPVTATINSLPFVLGATIIMLLAITYLFGFTAYGYSKRAIEGNQILARDAGINILINCIICYSLAGALVAVSGTFETAYKGSLIPVLNNGTVSVISSGLLTFMLGRFISRWTNLVIGIAVATLTMRIFVMGLSKLMLSINIQNLILYLAFIVFLIISANYYNLEYNKNRKIRIQQAHEIKSQLGKQTTM
jgi:ribose/xylose/arabinose/galactoside ABC-type transport system permease subunit